jgi:hypothetical protein
MAHLNCHCWNDPLQLFCDSNNNNTLFTKSNTAYRHITIFAKLIKNQYIPKIEIVVDFAEKSLFQ